jgi:hypothetical protein
MGLSNAERQRRYIQRLKARASGVTNAPDTVKKGRAGGVTNVTQLTLELAHVKAKLSSAMARIMEMSVEHAGATKPNERVNDERVRKLEAELNRMREQEERGWRHARRGIKFTNDEYRLIKALLHPRPVDDAERQKEHAYKIFTDKMPEAMFREKKNDLSKPPKAPPMPSTAAEWDAAKRRATAERKAKRAKRQPAASPKSARTIAK